MVIVIVIGVRIVNSDRRPEGSSVLEELDHMEGGFTYSQVATI